MDKQLPFIFSHYQMRCGLQAELLEVAFMGDSEVWQDVKVTIDIFASTSFAFLLFDTGQLLNITGRSY